MDNNSQASDTQRDQHIQTIAEQGHSVAAKNRLQTSKLDWAGHMQRYKRIFGNSMKARALPHKKNSEKARNNVLRPNSDLFNNAGNVAISFR